MMTARHLVRRLLALRSSSPPVGNLMLEEAQHFGRNAQAAVHADFGLPIQVENKMPEANGQRAIAQQSSFDNHLSNLDRKVGAFSYRNSLPLDQNGLCGQSGFFGHQSLPSQASSTVSGFWVPFKRKPTPQQGEAT